MKKISNLELEQLVRKGLGVSEIARKLRVSKGAVSKRLKALKVAITRDVTLHHAGEIVEKKINAIEQLESINKSANQILAQAMSRLGGDKESIGDDGDQALMNNPRDLALKISNCSFNCPRISPMVFRSRSRGLFINA